MLVTLVDGTHESNELAGNDPVKITVFDFFVVLVLLDIESLEVIPTELYALLKAFETMLNRALVAAVTLRSISKWFQKRGIVFELAESGVGILAKNNDAESAHQEGGIGHLLDISTGAVVVDTCTSRELLALQQLRQLATELVHHRKIQGTEVFVERQVTKFLNRKR